MYHKDVSLWDKIRKSSIWGKLWKTVVAYVVLVGLFNYGGIAIQGPIVWFLLFGLIIVIFYWHAVDWVDAKLNEFETMKDDIKTIKRYLNKIKFRGKSYGKK